MTWHLEGLLLFSSGLRCTMILLARRKQDGNRSPFSQRMAETKKCLSFSPQSVEGGEDVSLKACDLSAGGLVLREPFQRVRGAVFLSSLPADWTTKICYKKVGFMRSRIRLNFGEKNLTFTAQLIFIRTSLLQVSKDSFRTPSPKRNSDETALSGTHHVTEIEQRTADKSSSSGIPFLISVDFGKRISVDPYIVYERLWSARTWRRLKMNTTR